MYYYMICRFLNEQERLSGKAYAYELNEKDFKRSFLGARFGIRSLAGYEYHNGTIEITGLIPSHVKFEVGIDDKTGQSRLIDAETDSSSFNMPDRRLDIKEVTLTDQRGFYASAVVYSEEFTSIPNVDKPVVVKRIGLKETFDSVRTATRFLEERMKMDRINEKFGIPKVQPKFVLNDSPVRDTGDAFRKMYMRLDENKNENKKENSIMNGFNKIFGGLEFGKYTGRDIKMSMKGLAYRTAANKYVAYSDSEGTLTDVTDFLFDFDGLLFLMPVAVKDIAVGDIVRNNTTFVIVTAVEDGKLTVIDPLTNEVKTIIPVRNIFGFNFYTKVVNIMGNLPIGTVDAENPFGNMLPMMLLMGDNDNGFDAKTFMLMNMMNGGGLDFAKNPMMLYALMGQDGNSDMKNLLPLMMMQNGNPFQFGMNIPASK